MSIQFKSILRLLRSLRSLRLLLFGGVFAVVGMTQVAVAQSLSFSNQRSSINFAQMYLGYEYNLYSANLPVANSEHTFNDNIANQVVSFGGWHFWGMADFFVSIPIETQELNKEGLSYKFSPGFESAFKWYPIPLAADEIRPFIGAGFSFYQYQANASVSPLETISYPFNVGFSVANNAFQLDIGMRYLVDQEFSVPVSYNNNQVMYKKMTLDSAAYYIGIKQIVDTTQQLASKGKKVMPEGRYGFLGVGASAIWISDSQSSYFENNASGVENKVQSNIVPDISLGWHIKNSRSFAQRMIVSLAYRQFNETLRDFSNQYNLGYRGIALEIAQSLFDYHGFVPFVGLSYNDVALTVSGSASGSDQKRILGGIVGWDLLPIGDGDQWTLRSHVRWYPEIALDMPNGQKIAFPNMEFTVVQWVYQFE